ncbi:hypothetical protein [Chitinasiproducens palmae]|uniref:Uncharacterized protein n=1 Tax=Chitinasiproducens palmae TaxID=1770053 RepID=A0A1H2PMU0_9BURK|nr:hypothetical protein [Chitinasiproducens palmae]SDV47935.1 hypothetical protein SAMN05216551_10412 [Chitinasiproducens palmae]
MKAFLVKVTLQTGPVAPYYVLARSTCEACVQAMDVHGFASRITVKAVTA